MGYKTAYNEVMRLYEADRNKAQALLDAKREEIYRTIPRVKEIDKLLAEIGLSLARLALKGDDHAINQARMESQNLQKEKACLIPENYFNAVYCCVHCADTGYIERERCACLKQRLIEKYYDLSNIRSVLEKENFDTFDLRYYSMKVYEAKGISPHTNMHNVYKEASQFVLQFNNEFKNLLLYGGTGLGKTFISNCIAKDLLDLGRTVLYVTAPRLFKIIEDYRFNRNEMTTPDEMLDAVTEVDLLILDDLGAEFSTIVTSSALFDIINQRLLLRKPTVISTNLSPPELKDQYSDRIVSRFYGNFRMLELFGFVDDDIRIKKKYRRRG